MEMPINFIQQGWQCPVCWKVHAPWVSECDCHKCNASNATTPNTKWESITIKTGDKASDFWT